MARQKTPHELQIYLSLQVLDERDATLRSQLGSVKDGSSELAQLTSEAEKIIRDARSEVSALVNKQKSEKQAELDKVYAGAAGIKLQISLFCLNGVADDGLRQQSWGKESVERVLTWLIESSES